MTDHTEMQIPGDVIEAARQAFRLVANTYGGEYEMVMPIARAILAERERCARIGEEAHNEWMSDSELWNKEGMENASRQSVHMAHAAAMISAKIRSVDK